MSQEVVRQQVKTVELKVMVLEEETEQKVEDTNKDAGTRDVLRG